MTTIYSRLVDDFTDDEKYLVGQADAGSDNAYKKLTLISEIYIARMHRQAAWLMIDTSKEIAKASEVQAKSLIRATWVLAGAAIALVLATLVLVFAAV
jgi:hypothetical protein